MDMFLEQFLRDHLAELLEESDSSDPRVGQGAILVIVRRGDGSQS